MTAIERMKAGFRSFRAAYYQQRPERIRDLVSQGQRPEAMLIACSDSRVDPAILMNAEPGEMFVVRTVAALVPPYERGGGHDGVSAALEYAVRDLRVRDVVALAHSGCGGARALVSAKRGDPPERECVNSWMSLAHGCCGEDCEDPDEAGKAALAWSLRNLRGFPFVASAVEAGALSLHGWWFDMKRGELLRLNEETGRPEPLL